MKTVKINLASEAQLDWLIGSARKVEGLVVFEGKVYAADGQYGYRPTDDPEQMQPLIHEYKISVLHEDLHEFDPSDPDDDGSRWHAYTLQTDDTKVGQYEETPLMAAARVLCLQFYGHSAKVPEELT